MPSPADARLIRIVRTFDATPEEVWAAWTRPEHVARWWNPSHAADAVVHECDPRVGGLLRLTMKVPEAREHLGTDEFPVHATFTDVRPPHGLALRFTADDASEGEATLRVRFEPVGARTRMTFEFTPDADGVRADMEEGWGVCLDRLALHLDRPHDQEAAKMNVPTTPAVRLERTLDCTPEALFAAFTRPEMLAKWISPFPGLDAEVHELDPRVGGRISFTMVDAQGNRYPEEHGVFEVVSPREVVQFQANDKRDDIFKGHPQRIRATFEPVDAGRTRLVVEVYGMPPQIPLDAAAQGFGATLDKLAALVQTPKPAPLRLERTLDASPEEVWAAWTRPELYAKWLNPSPADLVIHEWDLRGGGRVRFDMPQPDGNLNPQEGMFHVLEPHTRLVSGSEDRSFLLEVQLQPRGSRTHLVVSITGVPPEWHAAATQGWGQCLDKLERVLKQTRA